MSLDNAAVERIDNLISGLLNSGYTETAGPVLEAIGSSTDSGRIAQRLDELDEEAQRLAELGLKIEPDNPVLRALTADLAPVLDKDAALIGGSSGAVQENGIASAEILTRQLALPGFDDLLLDSLGVIWNVPDPQAVNALVGYVQSEAWVAELAAYGPDVIDVINNQAIIGIVNGQGARRTSAIIRRMTENLPAATADNLMRTLQIQSYQTATAANQLANSHILVGQIRIEALDDRTCLACIRLHGSELPLGEKVVDHHQGRGTAISIVGEIPGLTELRPREVVTGPQWFASLDKDRQRRIAGHANFEALEAGRVSLDDFVDPYQDDVFGDMLRETSLSKVLGDEASEFYKFG